jgi:suppressor of ftsI
VNVAYGGSVDLVMDFTDPIIRGMSLFHCHLLSHEDKGMMAKILFR